MEKMCVQRTWKLAIQAAVNDSTGKFVETTAALYHDDRFPNIYVKHYGLDGDNQYFVFWRHCWKGGGVWDSDACGKEPDQITLLPTSSLAKQVQDVESAFDASEWAHFWKSHGIKSFSPCPLGC